MKQTLGVLVVSDYHGSVIGIGLVSLAVGSLIRKSLYGSNASLTKGLRAYFDIVSESPIIYAFRLNVTP